ncbi:MAG: MauE/DoxX family redox-associated membrane protein, partial [Desulfomonilaceae bacterium]
GDEHPMNMMSKYISLFARLIIGFIFIYASAYKVLNPGDFAVSIRNYMILPVEWTNFVAVTLPWVELGAGILLILGILTRPSALLTTGMLLVFLMALIHAYWIGLDINCGCFSSAAESTEKISLFYLLRDTCLVIISALILVLDHGHFSVLRKNNRKFV